jgi:hypothetical protein
MNSPAAHAEPQASTPARVVLLVIACACGFAPPALGAEPAIRDVNIRGFEIGAPTTIIVDGDELGTTPKLLLPFAARQELKPGATDKRATFEVVPDATTIPGIYQFRIVAEGGVSLPIVIGVDRLPQRSLAKTNEQLPVALHGSVAGPAVVETSFAGKAGQKIVAEVDAQRFGSKLRPVIHLSHTRGRQIAWSWGRPALFGDTRLEAVLPADGDYTISVHDAEYSPPGPGFFRLRVGQWSFVDHVYPLAVGISQPRPVEFVGGTVATGIEVPAQQQTGAIPVAWPGEALWSGPRPFVLVSPFAELVEQRAAGAIQDLPAGAVGVSGKMAVPFEEDGYRIPVTAGTKLRLEVWAERYGSPVDTALVVRNDAGAILARAEDGTGSVDPVLEYTVPDKMTSVIVGVLDTLGQGHPDAVYRLTIDPQTPETAAGSFRLTTPTPRVSLPIGGRWVIPVFAERRGLTGPIELTAAQLPAGATLESAAIPAGAEGTLLTVSRGDALSEPALFQWTGRAADGTPQPVTIPGHPLERVQPWLAGEIAFTSSNAIAADFQVDWRGLPSDAGLVPAGKLPLPIKLVRPASDSPVRFTLMTSQPPILVNGQPDPNRALRAERPVELAANVAEGEVTLLLPPELPASIYDVSVQAELLTADKQRVLATAFAPVRRLPVRMPLAVQLAGAPRITAEIDPKVGATVKVVGQVERSEGLTGDVSLALTGLPAGARADAVNVKADATEFTVNLILPANLPAGEFKGLKLSASGPAPGQPALRVRSRDVDLVIVTTLKPG